MSSSLPLIAPSLLAADSARLGEEVQALEHAGADRLHFDVMDGHFVPHLSFGPHILKALKQYTTLPIDAHLMVTHPLALIKAFSDAGAQSVTLHVEIGEALPPLLRHIKATGAQVGLALNPETSPSLIEPFLNQLDLILLMMVHPGRGGQSFLSGQEKKVEAVRHMINNFPITLHVDGGITPTHAKLLKESGADVLVAGTSILQAPCYRTAIHRLRHGL